MTSLLGIAERFPQKVYVACAGNKDIHGVMVGGEFYLLRHQSRCMHVATILGTNVCPACITPTKPAAGSCITACPPSADVRPRLPCHHTTGCCRQCSSGHPCMHLSMSATSSHASLLASHCQPQATACLVLVSLCRLMPDTLMPDTLMHSSPHALMPHFASHLITPQAMM
jgi:hypothetical protein